MAENVQEYILKIRAQMDQSVQQALSTIVGEVTTLSKEIREVQGQLRAVGDGTDLNVEPLQQELKRMNSAVRNLSTPVKNLGEESLDTSRAMDQWSRTLDKMENDFATLPVKIDLVTKEMQQMEAAGGSNTARYRALAIELARLSTVQDNLQQSTARTGNSTRRLRQNVQNIGFQVQDLVVSMQNGTRASVAFAQQVPQALVGFGAIGAAVGVAATVIAVVAGKYIDQAAEMLSSNKALEKSTKELEDAFTSFNREAKDISLDDYVEQLQTASKASNELVSAIVEQDLELIITKSEAAAKATGDAFKSSLGEVADEFRFFSGGGFFGNKNQQIDLDATLGLSATAEQAKALNEALNGINIEENIAKVLPLFDLTVEKEREMYNLMVQLSEQTKIQSLAAERLYEARQAQAAIESGNLRFFERKAEKEAQAAISLLAVQEARNRAFDAEVRQAYELGKITEEQLKSLLRIKETQDESKKIVDNALRSWEKLVEETRTLEETRDRDLAAIKALAKELEDLKKAGKIDIEIDQEALDRASAKVQELYEEAAKKEAYEALSDMEKVLYDLAENAQKSADNLAAFNNLQFGATAEQMKAMAGALGDAVPLSVQLNLALAEFDNARDSTAEATKLINEMAVELGLTAEEVEYLQSKFVTTGEVAKSTFEEVGLAIGNQLPSAVSGLVGVLTDSEQSFSDWARSLIKQIASVIAEMLLLKAITTALGATSFGQWLGFTNTAAAAPVAPVTTVATAATSNIVPLAANFSSLNAASSSTALSSGQGQGNVSVNVSNYTGEPVQTRQMGDDIDVIVGRVAEDIRRGGSRVSSALENTYSVSRARGTA